MERDLDKEVRQWFAQAKKTGTAHINLYYQPLRDKFNALTKRRYLGKVFVGHEFEGFLYEIQAGWRDCEEILVCKGSL